MANIRDFLMPDLGEGLEEGEIVEWLVSAGQEIELNDNVAVVETAKAAVEVPSPFAGTVVELLAEVGATVEVGTAFIRIDVDKVAGGADISEVAAPAGEVAPEVEEGGAPSATQASFEDTPGEAKAAAKSTGLDADEEPQPLVGYGQGKGGKKGRRRRGKAASSTAPAPSGNGQADAADADGPVLAKPPVRKLAKDLGVDLASIAPGSGEGGVITRDDVRAAAGEVSTPQPAGPSSAPQPAPQPAAVSAPTAAAPTFSAPSGGEKPVPGFRGRAPGDVEAVRGVRKRIIAKMETSRGEIPEAYCSRWADLTELWELRKDLTEQAEAEGFDVKITPFALILRAVVLALRKFPTLNATLDTDANEIRLIEHINLGFAADTNRGLVVPNIKDAHGKSVLQIAAELNELAGKARDGRATPEDLTGGTFTVSNYGAFGNDDGMPVINHPESGILGVGAIRERPWVVDGEVQVRRTCKFTLSFDHRISDGGEAGRFVTYVGDLCEHPSRILLHS